MAESSIQVYLMPELACHPCAGSKSFRLELLLSTVTSQLPTFDSALLFLDADVPPINLHAFRLEAYISRLRIFIVGDGGDECPIEIGMHLAIFGNDFNCVPF